VQKTLQGKLLSIAYSDHRGLVITLCFSHLIEAENFLTDHAIHPGKGSLVN